MLNVNRSARAATVAVALRAAPLALAVSLLALPAVAWADNVSELSKAEQAYASLDYTTANGNARALLAKGDLSHDELLRATRIVALTSVALDKPSEAKDAFVLLLTYDPTYVVDSKLGPKYREPFNEAKGYWAAQSSKPGMELSAMVSSRAPGSVRVITRDPTNVIQRVIVSYRWAPAKNFIQAAAKTGDAHVDVPTPPAGASRLDYFARAEDKNGNAVFEAGSAASPKFSVVQLEPTRSEAKESKSVFASPLFWIVAGVLVAGATTGGILLATQGGETTTVVSNRWSPALGCGGSRCE